ncbi:MAG: LamG-like jellyroll fold domain-containing protein [Paludibacter sp.]
MKKNYFLAIALFVTLSISAQTIIYSNNFNSGVGTSSIVGNGVIETATTGGFESVFHNAAGGQGTRANYLLLPNDVLANLQTSGSKELSIAFWVNKGTAINYFYSPIFSAYGAAPIAGANTWPMLVLQSRLLAQVNCAGWTDLASADNVNAVNLESSVWQDDAAWHYYTATFTETSVKIYVDGVVKNAWAINGTDGHTVNGLFTNGGDLKYICLGGNQAWNWGDPDPAYLFDDLAIYSNALTVPQINAIISSKLATSINSVSDNNGEIISQEFFSISSARVGEDYNKLASGIYIKKSVYSNGVKTNTKIVKSL